jgi:proteasome assembly chaperone (PAC2) family protein
MLGAEEFGLIEPWELFYPRKATIRGGVLEELEFPSNTFFHAHRPNRDVVFFIGEEQPTLGRGPYAEGRQAWDTANMVIDVAEELGCQRIYTSGAAVSPIHHTTRPRVWASPNTSSLLKELKTYPNCVLMSEVEGHDGQGSITGLNGLMLGVARQRGIDAVCLMGEIPQYLSEIPFAYPRASRAVLEVLSSALKLELDLSAINHLIERSDREVELLYQAFPADIREQLDKLRRAPEESSSATGPITDADKRTILEEVERFFNKGSKENQS